MDVQDRLMVVTNERDHLPVFNGKDAWKTNHKWQSTEKGTKKTKQDKAMNKDATYQYKLFEISLTTT